MATGPAVCGFGHDGLIVPIRADSVALVRNDEQHVEVCHDPVSTAFAK